MIVAMTMSAAGRHRLKQAREVLSGLPSFLGRYRVCINIGDRLILTEPHALGTSIALFAFEDLSRLRVHRDCSEGTGRKAESAPNASLLIVFHNTQVMIFLEGSRGADGTAQWFLTLLTGHGDSDPKFFIRDDLNP